MDDKIQATTIEQENAALSFSAGGWLLCEEYMHKHNTTSGVRTTDRCPQHWLLPTQDLGLRVHQRPFCPHLAQTTLLGAGEDKKPRP